MSRQPVSLFFAVQVYCERKRFKGVSRSPWSLTWESHVPLTAAGTQAGTETPSIILFFGLPHNSRQTLRSFLMTVCRSDLDKATKVLLRRLSLID